MVPYQLHCCPDTALDGVELRWLVGTEDAGVEVLPPLQIFPVITGRSALPPRLST